MNIRRVVFFVSRRTGAQAVAEACAELLSRAGISLCAPKKYSEPLTLPSAVELLDDEESVKSADLVLVIGGDGTILRANYYAAPYAIPILGINMGRLGFLSELEPGETALVEKVLCGQFRIEERMMLSAEVHREGMCVYRADALNDICVNRAAGSKILSMDILADSQFLARFRADGVIISTPTGSTAYSLAAGGPIIEPTLKNTTITPICAHGLYAKSFVLAPQREVQLVLTDSHGAALSPDGREGFEIGAKDEIRICQSPYSTRLVRIKGKNVFEIIRDKLNYDYN